ncbi:MAG: hypothetical protein AB7S26_21760 [Sandaracinaceae bacterium]
MTSIARAYAVLSLLVLASCDGPVTPSDGSPGSDAGGRADAGPLPPGTDAGPLPPGTDAGPPGDAGPPPADTECNDGIDNDGDGLIDWQRDVGCYGSSDRTESAGPRAEEGGFTTYDLASDSVVYYVSADGDDANDGLTPETALLTITHAADLVTDGSHDFILLRRGDTFRDQQLGRFKSGRSAVEPLVIASYGDSTDRPRLELGSNFIDHNGRERSNVAILGLTLTPFRNIPGDPQFTGDSPQALRYVGGGSGLLVEGCHIHYGEIVVQSADPLVYSDVEIRRNVIERAYHADTCIAGDPNGNVAFRPSGIFGSGITRFLIEENVFDHNGWNLDEVPTACATIYNHNVYLPHLTDSTIRGNVFARASSIHIKTTATDPADYDGFLVDDNFFVGGEIGMSIGGNNPGPLRFRDVQIRNNVLSQVGRGRPTTRGLAWGIELSDHDGSVVEDNVLAHFDENNAWGIRFSGDTQSTVMVQDNLLYAVNGAGFRNTNQTAHMGITIARNEIVDPTHGSCLVRQENGFGGYTFATNRYFSSSGADWFCITARSDVTAWTSASGESDATALSAAPSYPEPDRTIDTYAMSIGVGTTLEDFLAAARQQSRLHWRTELMASAVNAYIRAGFGL